MKGLPPTTLRLIRCAGLCLALLASATCDVPGLGPMFSEAPRTGGYSPMPAACRVNDTQACAGCAITCRPGQQASCRAGTDSVPGADRCVFNSSCSCF